MIVPLLRSARPRQWVKNLFVLAALVFSGHLLDADFALTALAAAAAFLLSSASVYLINDVTDAHRDRLHPQKARRPVASGALPPRLAVSAAGVLLLGSL